MQRTLGGIATGRFIATKIPDRGLRRAFAAPCVLISIGLTIKSMLSLH